MYKQNTGLLPVQFYVVAGLVWLKLLLLRVLFFERIAWEWIVMDLAPVLLIMGILTVLLPRRMKKGAYWSFNVILSLLLFAASVYFNHFGSVPTYLAFYELNQVFQVKESVESTIQPVDYLFFADLALMAVYAGLRRWQRGPAYPGRSYSGGTRPAYSRTQLAVIWVAIIGGGSLSAYSVHAAGGITNELVQAESAGFLNYEVVAALKAQEDNRLIGTGDIHETVAKVNTLEASYPYSSMPAGTVPDYFGSQKGEECHRYSAGGIPELSAASVTGRAGADACAE